MDLGDGCECCPQGLFVTLGLGDGHVGVGCRFFPENRTPAISAACAEASQFKAEKYKRLQNHILEYRDDATCGKFHTGLL